MASYPSVRIPGGSPAPLQQLLGDLNQAAATGEPAAVTLALKDALGLTMRLFAGIGAAACLEFHCLPPSVARVWNGQASVAASEQVLSESLLALSSRSEELAVVLCGIFLGAGVEPGAVARFCSAESPGQLEAWLATLDRWMSFSADFWDECRESYDPNPHGQLELRLRFGEHLLRTGVVPRQYESGGSYPAVTSVGVPRTCPRNLEVLLKELPRGGVSLREVVLYAARFYAGVCVAACRELRMPCLEGSHNTLFEAVESLGWHLKSLAGSPDPLALSLRQIYEGQPFAARLGLQGPACPEIAALGAGSTSPSEAVARLLDEWMRQSAPFFARCEDLYESTGPVGQLELVLRFEGRRLPTGLYVRLAEHRRFTGRLQPQAVVTPAGPIEGASRPVAVPGAASAPSPRGLRLSHRDRAVFLRSLALMLNSGVSIIRSLEVLSRQGDSPRLAQASGDMSALLMTGQNLYQAMAAHPGLFEPYQLKLIQVGCETGRLAGILEKQAEHEERRHATAGRVRASLVQPAFVFVGTLALVILMPLFLFRGLLEMVQSTGVEMPWMTRVVLFASDLVRAPLFWLVLVGLALAGGRLLRQTLKNELARRTLAERLLAVPGLGSSLRILAVYRFASALELLVQAGASIAPGLTLAGEASSSPVLEHRLKRSVARLLDGEELTRSLEAAEFFPPMFLQAVSAGQEYGDLSKGLAQTSRLLELELAYRLEVVENMLEPVVMVCMGLVVGFTMVATMMPLLKVAESL